MAKKRMAWHKKPWAITKHESKCRIKKLDYCAKFDHKL